MAETPQYSANQGSPDALPKGAATQLNASMDEVQNVDVNTTPPTAFPESQIDDTTPPVEGNLTGLDHLVFSGTDRPNEPITHGAPTGMGPDSVEDGRSTKEKMDGIALALANSADVSSTSRAIMTKILRGD